MDREGGKGCEIKSRRYFTSKSQAAQNRKIQATATKKVGYKIKVTVKLKCGASGWKDMVERGQVLTSQALLEKGAWI